MENVNSNKVSWQQTTEAHAYDSPLRKSINEIAHQAALKPNAIEVRDGEAPYKPYAGWLLLS